MSADLHVREMLLEDTHLRIDYFHNASDEHLQLLGVSRAKLPAREEWLAFYEADYRRPIAERENYSLVWEVESQPVGFSSIDRIIYGEEAFMHLHILETDQRRAGYGSEFVRRSVEVYFDILQLKRLYSEPNAFNVAPNRTLQSAGFKYLFTHNTIPGPLNYHQTVNRWTFEPSVAAGGDRAHISTVSP